MSDRISIKNSPYEKGSCTKSTATFFYKIIRIQEQP